MTEVTQRAATTSRHLQPALHHLASQVAAPAVLLAGADGQVRAVGQSDVQGWYVGDVRRLRTCAVSVEGSDLELVRADTGAADRHGFTYVARGLGDAIPDPTLTVDRVRELGREQRDLTLVETLTVTSTAQADVDVVLHLDVCADATPVAVVKSGQAPPAGETERHTWRLTLRRGESRTVVHEVHERATGAFAAGARWRQRIRLEAADPSLRRTVEQSVADLEGLLLADGDDEFVAAGSPWFLTLFGRDALWVARMLAPFGTDLTLSTLRALARRQGTRDDARTEEQPGKILHEVREPELEHILPPVYYGSIDATPLFVCTLADAADWGADARQVAELLPAARRCLEWQMAASAETGWLRYVDRTGHGLANQGWKDSDDAVQFADGRLARAPIALCEVQAYAYEAAVRGATLLAAHGEPEVPGLAEWAADLKERFHREFWVGHVPIALDAQGRPVDAVASNMGHVLGTGILAPERAATTAWLLSGPDLASGFGLRTLSARSPRYSRFAYHGGTVWPHDTAIAVRGLAAEGFAAEASRLAADLLRAAPAFDHRYPELYGGDAAAEVDAPAAYPAACRPQAWSAAAPLAALVATTGLRIEDGRPAVPDRVPTRLGALTLHGIRHDGDHLSVEVAGDGQVILTSR